MARKRRRRDGRPTADEVLGGACTVDVAQLIGLINQVNPTGRGLAATEQTRRYHQKNRLQALLIERFAGALDVALDPAAPGAVSIRRCHFPVDACHAVIEQLDEESRSWIQRRLDEAEIPITPTPPLAVGSDHQTVAASHTARVDPLAAGRRALEEYDYERARALMSEALRRSGGAPEEAAALLDLLVDHLADDTAALRLETTLSKEARQSSRVKVLLALAAARAGDRLRARMLIHGVSVPREVDVWAALARDAMRDGALDEAEECLARVREIAPGHGEVPGIAGELARQRERETETLVVDMEQAWSEARHEEAERLAREVLSRCPGDTRATGILAQSEETRRSQQLQVLLNHAREAMQAARYQEAIDLWQRAARSGASDKDLSARIREAHRLLRRQHETGAVGEVVDLLASSRPEMDKRL
jgi:tetratricopeptide (TPR) repeat protein